MCILIFKPAEAPVPANDILANCFANNPDGCGYAVPGKKPRRFMTLRPLLAAIAAEDPSLPMIIHFRWATHGTPMPANCHPFYDKRLGVAFAHNGVMHPPTLMPGRTDSETVFRRYLAPAIESHGLFSEELEEAADFWREGGKLAFLDSDGRCRLFGDFIEHEGCYYSNMGFAADWQRRALWRFPAPKSKRAI